MSNDVYMQYDHAGYLFRWHGGAYIEAGFDTDDGFEATDVINVWDYAKDEPRIPRTLEAFQARCDEWIEEAEAVSGALCEDCGLPIMRDPAGSVGVWVHDASVLGERAFDLNEDHAARPSEEES